MPTRRHAPPDATALAAELAVEIGLLQSLFTALESFMTTEMTRLLASVSAVRGKAESLIALTATLAQFMRDHADDPAALTAMADDLDAEGSSIQSALDANAPPAG